MRELCLERVMLSVLRVDTYISCGQIPICAVTGAVSQDLETWCHSLSLLRITELYSDQSNSKTKKWRVCYCVRPRHCLINFSKLFSWKYICVNGEIFSWGLSDGITAQHVKRFPLQELGTAQVETYTPIYCSSEVAKKVIDAWILNTSQFANMYVGKCKPHC